MAITTRYTRLPGGWENGYQTALSMGAYLATLTSAGEENWIKTTFGSQVNSLWIGLTDSEAYGGTESYQFGWPNRQWHGWVWLEPTGPVPLTASSYRNWDAGSRTQQ